MTGVQTCALPICFPVTITGNSCTIKVEDDGVGLPENFDLKSNSNLGLQIVRTLAESELKGTLEFSGSAVGTTAQLHFDIR